VLSKEKSANEKTAGKNLRGTVSLLRLFQSLRLSFFHPDSYCRLRSHPGSASELLQPSESLPCPLDALSLRPLDQLSRSSASGLYRRWGLSPRPEGSASDSNLANRLHFCQDNCPFYAKSWPDESKRGPSLFLVVGFLVDVLLLGRATYLQEFLD